jgi:hypothetical protein
MKLDRKAPLETTSASRNKDNKLNLSKSLKKAETTDERTKPEGSKEDRTTLMIKDEYRKEIKRNEETTRSMKMNCNPMKMKCKNSI